MKTYHGYRLYAPGLGESVVSGVCRVRVSVDGVDRGLLPERQDIRNHSPAGFEWGYGGSGPAQLALALVAECAGENYCHPKIYQRVKKHVAQLPRDGWTLTNVEVGHWIAAAIEASGWCPTFESHFDKE